MNKVIELISKGADVNAKDKDERTPLHLAAQYGHTEIVELLLKKESIDVNAKNKYGQTPLHHAAWEDHTAIVELLLKKKSIDVNAKDEYDQTPLHSAALNGRTEIAVLSTETMLPAVCQIFQDYKQKIVDACSKIHKQFGC